MSHVDLDDFEKTHMSDHGKNVLSGLCGVRYKPYRSPCGSVVIGVGHKLTPSELSSGKIFIGDDLVSYGKKGLTPEQAHDLMEEDVNNAECEVMGMVKVPITQGQFDCLVSFCLDIGEDAFYHSALLSRLNAGEYTAVPDELRQWVHSAGKKVNGLKARRETEIRLWNEGHYE